MATTKKTATTSKTATESTVKDTEAKKTVTAEVKAETAKKAPAKKAATKKTATKTATTGQQKSLDKYAGIRAAVNSCISQDQLASLYYQHQNEVNGNEEVKAIFTQRKLQLQQAA